MHVQDMSSYSEELDPPMLKQQLLAFTVPQQVYNIIQWNVRYPNMSDRTLAFQLWTFSEEAVYMKLPRYADFLISSRLLEHEDCCVDKLKTEISTRLVYPGSVTVIPTNSDNII